MVEFIMQIWAIGFLVTFVFLLIAILAIETTSTIKTPASKVILRMIMASLFWPFALMSLIWDLIKSAV